MKAKPKIQTKSLVRLFSNSFNSIAKKRVNEPRSNITKSYKLIFFLVYLQFSITT